jgi:glycosyltransferase involved in cell wall biosynthesis
MPAVTVLMPVYNAERYLKEAIDSMLQQTFSDFEFLIIDDGSTDSSVAIINSYTDPRIRLVCNEENLGITGTLNKGIELCTTELIARMDADDISYPERLQKQYDFFQSHPHCALLSTWAREVTYENEVLATETLNPDFYYYNLTFECWIYHPAVMYKRSAVIAVGKYVATYAEDYDLWWRLTRKYKMHILPEVLLDYRTSTNSISRVVKKSEYENAHLQQVMRNIHYYTGPEFKLSVSEAEFLRSNLEPILKENRQALVNSFKKLDYINNCIEKKETAPGENGIIKKAAFYKKTRLIADLKGHISDQEIIQVLIQVRYWQLLAIFLKQKTFSVIYSFYARFLKKKTTAISA